MRRAIDTPCPPEPLGDVREHARAVGDLDVHVERGAQISRRQRLERSPRRVVLQEAGAGRADDADHVGDHRRRRLDAACAGTGERDLPNCIALQHHGVERCPRRSQAVATVDECRVHANVDRAVLECRCTDEADDHVELLGRLHVLRLDPVDARVVHRLEPDPRAEGNGRENRHLRRGVGARDVVRRIGLRVAESLRLGERVGKRRSRAPSP